MRLSAALRLEPGRLAAFTGAGGKSGALRRLAEELGPVLLTTTTHLGAEQRSLASDHVILQSMDDIQTVRSRLEAAGSLLVTGPLDPTEGKWTGLQPEWIDPLKKLASAAGAPLLVEADGAGGRWIKAPANHEPVIPSDVDLVVPVMGLGAIGRPLTDQIGHRIDRLESVAGMQAGKPITPDQVTRLITSSRGGLKAVPATAEVRPLLNAASSPELVQIGRKVAAGCLQSDRIQAVVLADTLADSPVMASIGRTAGVVLAAGGGSRMGELKQVKDWRGKPLVRWSVEAALAAGLDPVVVVVGAEAERVRACLADLPVAFVENPDWPSGQSSSMRAGLRAARGPAEGAIFLLADMPLVDGRLIEDLVRQHQSSLAPIVAPGVDGRRGNPVLFDRALFDALESVAGDQGGRALFDQHPVLLVPAGAAAVTDVDSPGDWQALDDVTGPLR